MKRNLTFRMKIKSTAILFFVLVACVAEAQKIKYKDIYPALAAKNYDEAGSKLIQFLSDEKNQDEANANLQMGLWLEDRLLKYDVVDDSTKVYEVGDSAVFFLEKAKGLITEKELKKKDEYYQSFFRRDLRTGEFGIKVSDVHLDIEKKVEAIEKRVRDVKSMHQGVVKVEESQKVATEKYQSLTNQFSSYNSMLLGADEGVKAKLDEIENHGRAALQEAENVKELAVQLGTDKYKQDAVLKSIDQFGTDGMSNANLRSGVISIWNFEEWARATKSEINGGVALFKTMIKSYSEEVREKKKKVKNGQDAKIEDMPSDLIGQFEQYDPESTVQKLLETETYEAQIIKQVDLQLNPALMDSSLIGPQLAIFKSAKEDAISMNSTVESISSNDLEESKKQYQEYLESFFQTYVTASKYVQDMQEWSRRQVKWLSDAVDYWSEKNRWGIDEKDELKYPLFQQDTPEDGFITMSVPVKKPDEIVVYGANVGASLGYIASFGPDRFLKWKLDFDLPSTKEIQYESDTLPAMSEASSFYIFNAAATKNNLALVSYTMDGVLNWSAVATVSKKPVEFKFDELTQELTVFLYPEEQLPLDSDELGYLVIDRSGKVR